VPLSGVRQPLRPLPALPGSLHAGLPRREHHEQGARRIMAYIKSFSVILRHRKNIALAQDLRIKPVYSMGHLHALWHEAIEQQEDGDLSKWTDEFIASCAAYSGPAPQFVQLLQKHGWLDANRVLHDWLDYAGEYLRGKYKQRNRDRLTAIWTKHKRAYGEKDEEKPLNSSGNVPEQLRTDKKERKKERPDGSAPGADSTADGKYSSQGVPKARRCPRCQVNGVFDSAPFCLECRFCSQCQELSEDLKPHDRPGGVVYLCQSCRPQVPAEVEL
jgi:hypothetical protein